MNIEKHIEDFSDCYNQKAEMDSISMLNSFVSVVPVRFDGFFWNPSIPQTIGVPNISFYFFNSTVVSNRIVRRIPSSGIVETPERYIVFYKTISPYILNWTAIDELEYLIKILSTQEFFNYDFMSDFQIFFDFFCNETIKDTIQMRLSKYGFSLYFAHLTIPKGVLL